MVIKKICTICLTTLLITSVALAEEKKDSEPSEVNADTIEYDMNTGIVTAEGNILIKNGSTRATSLHAIYNVNSKNAHLIGNVVVVRDDMRLTCDNLLNDGQDHIMADGNVVALQNVAPDTKYPNGDVRTFKGDHIDYFPDDRKHILIPTTGVAESRVEGTFSADNIEGWIEDERYIGRGNAHMISNQRDLEAGGDQVDYFGKENGKAILSGNAWATHDNNTMRGNRMIVYMDDEGKLKASPETENSTEKASSNAH